LMVGLHVVRLSVPDDVVRSRIACRGDRSSARHFGALRHARLREASREVAVGFISDLLANSGLYCEFVFWILGEAHNAAGPSCSCARRSPQSRLGSNVHGRACRSCPSSIDAVSWQNLIRLPRFGLLVA
jgi:hypothetical protein